MYAINNAMLSICHYTVLMLSIAELCDVTSGKIFNCVIETQNNSRLAMESPNPSKFVALKHENFARETLFPIKCFSIHVKMCVLKVVSLMWANNASRWQAAKHDGSVKSENFCTKNLLAVQMFRYVC